LGYLIVFFKLLTLRIITWLSGCEHLGLEWHHIEGSGHRLCPSIFLESRKKPRNKSFQSEKWKSISQVHKFFKNLGVNWKF